MTDTSVTPAYCGNTSTGVEVFASQAFLVSHTAEDAIRYATTYASPRAAAAEVTSYGPRDFGPSGRYWMPTGVVAWWSCPGGFRHVGFYNVVPGVGPAPATDAYPQPVR